jgi:hypothetical protein
MTELPAAATNRASLQGCGMSDAPQIDRMADRLLVDVSQVGRR